MSCKSKFGGLLNMKFLIGIALISISISINASNFEVNIQEISPFGPDIGFLLENTTTEKMDFSLVVIPEGCSSLESDFMNLRGSMSTIDSFGTISPKDYMVAYYSLATYNLKPPCLIKIQTETVVGDTRIENSYIVDVSKTTHKSGKTPQAHTVKKPIQIRHSLKRMNTKHYELTLLLQNHNLFTQLVQLDRLDFNCELGDVYIKQTDNFPDGIKNGRSAIIGNSWRAYKIILLSNGQNFRCSSQVILTSDLTTKESYSFSIEDLK